MPREVELRVLPANFSSGVLYVSHTMLTGTEILADFMKLMLLLGVVCKRSSSITEGVEECVIIQDKFGESAVAKGKHTNFSSLVVLKL